MTEKDRFDACLKLAEFGYRKFDGRRQYEWKVTTSVWALLFLAIVYLKRDPVPMAFCSIIATGYIIFWVRGTWVANANDKSMSDHYMKASATIITNRNAAPAALPPLISPRSLKWWVGFLQDWSASAQTLTAILLASLLYLVPQIGSLVKGN